MKQKDKLRKMLEGIEFRDTEFYSTLALEYSGNSRKLFKAVEKVLKRKDEVVVPQHHSAFQLVDGFIEFFTEKIAKIQDHIKFDDRDHYCYQSEDSKFEFAIISFRKLSETEVDSLLKKFSTALCALDPILTWILKHCHTAT